MTKILNKLVNNLHGCGLSQVASVLNLWLDTATEKQQCTLIHTLFEVIMNNDVEISEWIERNS